MSLLLVIFCFCFGRFVDAFQVLCVSASSSLFSYILHFRFLECSDPATSRVVNFVSNKFVEYCSSAISDPQKMRLPFRKSVTLAT